MPITVLTSREFLQNPKQAQETAANGPVFIDDGGRPTHVLIRYPDYRRMAGKRRNIVEALSMPGLGNFGLEIPRSRELPRPADLS